MQKKKKINFFPYNLDSKDIKPIYIEMDGWDENLTEIKNQNEFPENFKNYLSFLEKELQTPIKIISVGPDRIQTIHMA